MSVRIEEATSEASLHYLFMQVVNKAIHDSKNPTAPTEPADQEAAFYRIEQLGFQVGQRLLLQCLHRTAPSTRLPQQIDQIKFLCKDFWQAVFGKTIDNLKTNHRGVFVLQDRSFDWIARFSADASATETARMAVLYLAYPCGLLRGALASLGILATVTAEIPAFPQCIFQIRTLTSGDSLPPPTTEQ